MGGGCPPLPPTNQKEMARPTKNNADYFSHDAQMRNDVKVRALRKKFGLVGYAIWCFLLEILTDADYFRVKFGGIDRELLAIDFDVEVDELEAIVTYCCTIGLLMIEEDTLYSPTLIERLGGVLDRRESTRRNYNLSKNEQKSAECGVYDAETLRNSQKSSETLHNEQKSAECEFRLKKESKVKERKVKENKFSLSNNSDGVTAAERERFFEIFFFMNFPNVDAEVERFINHYTARGWKPNGSNSPAVDREALAKTWKPEQQGKRYPDNGLRWLMATYKAAKNASPDDAAILLREVEQLCTSGIPASHSIIVHCTERASAIIAQHRAPTKGKVGIKLTDKPSKGDDLLGSISK